jgi:hypothetical protein
MAHRAFLAMPFRPELRWIREAIRSATHQLSITLRAVDETLAPGEEIVAGIRQEIREATLAYVVLTDLNPNVMYELGLLHEASKPTILLADKVTLGRLPFDIRTRMIVTFEQDPGSAYNLTQAVIAATGRLLALYDSATRQQLATAAAAPTASTQFGSVTLSIASFDWEKIKNDGIRSVGRTGCSTNNISPYDDGSLKGWRLKAKCTSGDVVLVYVDLNGDIVSVDVQ